MLRMDQVHVVRHKILVEGQSIRSVSRQMSISRNTIRKYLKVSEPVRVVRQKKPSPVAEMIAPRVEEILAEWRGRTTAKRPSACVAGPRGKVGWLSTRSSRRDRNAADKTNYQKRSVLSTTDNARFCYL